MAQTKKMAFLTLLLHFLAFQILYDVVAASDGNYTAGVPQNGLADGQIENAAEQVAGEKMPIEADTTLSAESSGTTQQNDELLVKDDQVVLGVTGPVPPRFNRTADQDISGQNMDNIFHFIYVTVRSGKPNFLAFIFFILYAAILLTVYKNNCMIATQANKVTCKMEYKFMERNSEQPNEISHENV